MRTRPEPVIAIPLALAGLVITAAMLAGAGSADARGMLAGAGSADAGGISDIPYGEARIALRVDDVFEDEGGVKVEGKVMKVYETRAGEEGMRSVEKGDLIHGQLTLESQL